MARSGGMGIAVMLVSLSIAHTSSAQNSVMSAAGYTGFGVTPTANLLPWGMLSLAYDNEVVGGPTVGRVYQPYGTSGHNVVVGFGMLPFLEISGRMATNKIQTICFEGDGCGIRDLSFNAKTGISLDSDGKFKIALGATDFGGNANFFKTIYGVATYSPESFDFSAGYAHRSTGLVGAATPIDGLFASAAYRPLSWIQTHIEYDDRKAWVGARIFTPSNLLPSGWSASIGANWRVHGEDKGARSWLSAGLTIPLYKVPETRLVKTREIGEPSAGFASQNTAPNAQEASKSFSALQFSSRGLLESETSLLSTPADNKTGPTMSAEAPVKDVEVPSSELIGLADALHAKGFEDIFVGTMPNGTIAVKVNNATYNVNTADGLGVALGVIARRLSSYNARYRLVLTQRQVAIVGVVGNASCLADWIAMRPPRCVAGTLHTPGTNDVDALVSGADWKINNASQSWKTARFIFEPVLRTAVATEYGVLDYSAGLRSTIQQPLWKGAYLEWSHISPLAESSDFKTNGVYGSNALVSQTEKLLFHQVMRLPLEDLFSSKDAKTAAQWGATALTAHVAVGRINANYRGLYGELRWEPFEGHHRFGLQGGKFDRIESYSYSLPARSQPILASYRYSLSQTKTDFEISGGSYLYRDRGAQFLITQWFDDVALNLYLRRTKYDYEQAARTFAGIELVIPLTPRKDMNPVYHAQITGAARWAYGIETRVGSTNFIGSPQGIVPGVAVLDNTFNSDRSGVYYFEENMPRIRSAAAL